MKWQVNLSQRAKKAIAKLDNPNREKLQHFMTDILPHVDNPRFSGKALQGNLKGLWRYRIGDYRLICQIKDGELLILVLELGHRKDIYQ